MLIIQFLNDIIGPLIIKRYQPIGINELQQKVKRSMDNDGMVYEIIIDLEFIKGGRLYLKKAYELAGGIDADVTCIIFKKNENTRKNEVYFVGSVKMDSFRLHEDRMVVNTEQIGFERRVLNLFETDINIFTTLSENGSALPATPFFTIPYHSKAIQKQTITEPASLAEVQTLNIFKFHIDGFGVSRYRDGIALGNIDTTNAKFSELKDVFALPAGYIAFGDGENAHSLGVGDVTMTVEQYKTFLTQNLEPRFEMYRAFDSGVMEVNITLNLKHDVHSDNPSGDIDTCGTGALGHVEIHAWFEHRDQADNIKYIDHIGEWAMEGCGENDRIGGYETKSFSKSNVAVALGDKIYVYETVRIFGAYNNDAAGGDEVTHDVRVTPGEGNEISFVSVTTAPTSNVKSVLLFDVFNKACQYVTNQTDCFRSSLLGRTDTVVPYDVDGEGSLIATTNGNNLRGRDKEVFFNLKDLHEATNSLFCTGLGFETINGKSVLVYEKKSHFYNKNLKILSLNKVAKIVKKPYLKGYYNQVEVGYLGKLDIGAVNGIDEFNTVRRFTIPIVNTKNQLKVGTKIRTSGYQIEHQRRLSVTTEDSKLDDENFFVCVVRDGVGFKTEQAENFTNVENVFDPASSYNLRISPARNLRNWFQIIAASLIRSFSKLLKFSFGEVNYKMKSTMIGQVTPIDESGNYDLTGVEPLWDNEIYTFEHPLNTEGMTLIKANHYGYIEFFDQFEEKFEGFVLNVDHSAKDGIAEFELLKVHRP